MRDRKEEKVIMLTVADMEQSESKLENILKESLESIDECQKLSISQ